MKHIIVFIHLAWNALAFTPSQALPKFFTQSPQVLSLSSSSWEDLQEKLEKVKTSNDIQSDSREPLVTLYRDTNGWCPFCERVWVCLKAKNIPYRERLINLQDKPEWYKELVPTTLVPALVFHDDALRNEEEVEGKHTERRVVWESSKIIEALDEVFPDSLPRLVLSSNSDYEEAEEMSNELSTAGFQFIYAGRNASVTEEETMERKEKFMNKLDELNKVLLSNENGGPFRLGKEFSAIDAMMIPMLERWRYQLPITHEIDILEGRPGLQQWFEGMEQSDFYADRVAGDKYSWTAVTSVFLRLFSRRDGEEELTDAVKANIERADAAASALENSFIDECREFEETKNEVVLGAKIRAAEKILSNYENIVKDCTNKDAKSQKDIARANDETSADKALRFVVDLILSSIENKQTVMSDIINKEEKSTLSLLNSLDASLAMKTIARRLCVPRDIDIVGAVILRGALSLVANKIQEENISNVESSKAEVLMK